MPVTTITSAEQWETVTSKGLVVVDFFATWCKPCKEIAPFLEELSNNPDVTQHGFKFFKVNVDDFDFMPITCMPTFVFFYNGKIQHTIEGKNQQAIVDAINQYYVLPYLSETKPAGGHTP